MLILKAEAIMKNKDRLPIIPLDFLNASWGMFTTTGNPGYYILYKRILEEEEKEKEKNKFR